MSSAMRLLIVLGSFFVLMTGTQVANSKNVLEGLIEAAQPCQSLKYETEIGTVGIDNFGGAEIKTFELSVDKSSASARVIASLRCKTSDRAIITGDVSVTVDLNMGLDLNACGIKWLDAHIVDTGGTFSSLVELFRSDIELVLRNTLITELSTLCE